MWKDAYDPFKENVHRSNLNSYKVPSVSILADHGTRQPYSEQSTHVARSPRMWDSRGHLVVARDTGRTFDSSRVPVGSPHRVGYGGGYSVRKPSPSSLGPPLTHRGPSRSDLNSRYDDASFSDTRSLDSVPVRSARLAYSKSANRASLERLAGARVVIPEGFQSRSAGAPRGASSVRPASSAKPTFGDQSVSNSVMSELERLKARMDDVEAESSAFLNEGIFDFVKAVLNEQMSNQAAGSKGGSHDLPTVSAATRTETSSRFDEQEKRIRALEQENIGLREELEIKSATIAKLERNIADMAHVSSTVNSSDASS